MKTLKLCNIKNIYETRTAGRLGVPFLGYHLISDNDFRRGSTIKACVAELRQFFPETKSILVTKERDAAVLSSLIQDFEFDGIQLHYDGSNAQATALRGRFGANLTI